MRIIMAFMDRIDACASYNEKDYVDFYVGPEQLGRIARKALKPLKIFSDTLIFKDNKDHLLALSRDKQSNIMSSGIQILNPAKINEITNKTENFNNLWDELIHLKEIKCSRMSLDSWYSVDDLVQLENATKKRN